MILRIRKQIRFIVSFLLFVFLQTYSAEVYALTSGPAQEEYASFEPVGTTDLVNLYTGDFTYNIPLLSVPGPNGGYPINLAYHSGIGMDQEASWVGLGWNVNVGAVNRNLRGLPDDFNGDKISYKRHMRQNKTFGVNLFQESKESLGIMSDDGQDPMFGMSNTLQIYYNNYKGMGYRVRTNPTFTSGAVSLGVNLSYDPHEGIGVGTSFNVSAGFMKGVSGSLGVSGQYNSRQGLQGMTISGGLSARASGSAKGKDGSTTKNAYGGGGASLTGGVTFNFSQGVPATTMEMRNITNTFDFKLGFTAGETIEKIGDFYSRFPLNYTFEVATSDVAREEEKIEGYGYWYAKEGISKTSALNDFSFSPFSYNRKVPNVPPSNVTNDVFAVTGQGISGVFKAYHSDLGAYSPKQVVSTTKQYRESMDMGLTSPGLNSTSCAFNYHFGFGGIPVTIGTALHSTGPWRDHKALINPFNFKEGGSVPKPLETQRTFFKDMGDRPALIGGNTFYDAWNRDEAVNIDIGGVGGGGVQMHSFTTSAVPDANNDLNKRTRVIQSLTKAESVAYGKTNNYEYYDVEKGQYVGKYADEQEDHHISELSILEPDGMRYTYGLPAYNLEQEDASFSVKKVAGEIPPSTTSVPSGGYDKAEGDVSKKPEFMDKKELPPYAHSWMLTSVVSADYVDRTGDGVSSDDLGYWVDFKYQKTTSAYHWRAPYSGAIYMPGLGQDFDDKGSYSKGKKELFYLKEIRTKTHVAVFELQERDDALGASTDPNGGKPTISPSDRMQALKKIKLYTVHEYEKGLNDPNYTAVPLKTTHFGYEEDSSKELCQGVPNRDGAGGKLTLKKLWFTYQNSTKGSSSPYVFHYGKNESYSLENNDCWGNYQNNKANYPHHQFPYTDQSTTNYIGQPIVYDVPWNLEQIDLPTGSSMYIEYEQDDYAYVEDKKAMQLYEIVGMGKNFPTSANMASLRNQDQINAGPDMISPDFEYTIYFPLKNSIPDIGGVANDFYEGYSNDMNGVAKWFRDHYIGEVRELYFKTAVKLLENSGSARDAEDVDFVGGYGELRMDEANRHYGVTRSSGDNTPGAGVFDIGYITLNAIEINAFGIGKDHIHPFRDAAFQHLRNSRQDLAFGAKYAGDPANLFAIIPDMIQMAAGYKYAYKMDGKCADIFLDGFSQIRLQVPDGKKRGGGVRVKEIKIVDNWEQMTGGGNSDYKNAEYGQIYDYTIEEGGKKISSGVAYEPFAGKEQNPMVVPTRYKYSSVFQQPNNLFVENPIMMMHYPGASVGYRQVTVKSLSAKDTEHKRHTTPITEYNFYSPKEFPIQFKQTEPDKVGPNYKVLPLPGVFTDFHRYEGVSQGYSLIFNDMPGKPKSIIQRTYPNSDKGYEGTVISKQEYAYFTDEEGNLDNEVDVFTEDGNYEKARLGVEVDIQIETNENRESSDNFTLDVNLMSGIITIPQASGACIPFPMLASGGISLSSSSVKTAVVQKFVHKKGILKSTTITTQNSSIKTENLVFDALTSEPLLTRTMNEFKDPIYNYTQKAHWHYDGMAAAFKNIGTVLNGPYNYMTSGNHANTYLINNLGSVAEFPLVEGDEVFITYDDNGIKKSINATVFSISTDAGNKYVGFVKQEDGSPVEEALIDKITVTRSGRRNLLKAPAGAIVAQGMDYVPNTTLGVSQTLTFDETKGILNASAIKYRDFWPNAKNCSQLDICTGSYCMDLNLYPNLTATNLPNKLKIGTIDIQLNGQSLDHSDITVGGDCSGDLEICSNTEGTYTVELVKSDGTTIVPTYTADIDACFYWAADVVLPCKPKQLLSTVVNTSDFIAVDGQIWDNSLIQKEDDCFYAKGYFRENFVGEPETRPATEVACILNNVSQLPPAVWPFTTAGGLRYNFQWPGRVNTGWQGYIHNDAYSVLSSMDNLKSQVIAGTGKAWYIDPAQPNDGLYAYMPRGEANDLLPASLGLSAFSLENNTLFPHMLSVYVKSPNLLNCHPYPNYNRSDEIWYDFEYDPVIFHELRVEKVPSGQRTIKYVDVNASTEPPPAIINELTLNVPQDYKIWVDKLNVQLPAGESGTVNVYDANGVLVNSAPFNTTSSYVKINFPLTGVGSHQLAIFNTGINTAVETATLECKSINAIASKVPICNGDDLSYVPSSTINYYNNGTKGNWRPWTSYTYVGERDYNKESIRDKGVFTTFSPFNWAGANATEWQRGSLATKYSSSGYELETVDRLGNHSTALYGYEDNLPVAVAQNARYNEVMFDGFETYSKDCNAHWGGVIDVENVVSTESHTGEYSYKIPYPTIGSFTKIDLSSFDETDCANALAKELYRLDVYYKKQEVLQFLQEGIELEGMTIPQIMRTTTKGASDVIVKALPQACNCLGKFAPQPGKKYTFSAWVKRDEAVYDMIAYKTLSLTIHFNDASGARIGNPLGTAIAPKGSMIEHWQRISGDVLIPSNAVSMEITVFNFGEDVYIDDLRIHPSDAMMTTYVYDKTSLKNTATLDDNNFATFYIYDERGQLEKTKKETTEGIKTITEGRQYIRSNQ